MYPAPGPEPALMSIHSPPMTAIPRAAMMTHPMAPRGVRLRTTSITMKTGVPMMMNPNTRTAHPMPPTLVPANQLLPNLRPTNIRGSLR
jgi:hypothetical protein